MTAPPEIDRETAPSTSTEKLPLGRGWHPRILLRRASDRLGSAIGALAARQPQSARSYRDGKAAGQAHTVRNGWGLAFFAALAAVSIYLLLG